MERHDRNNFLFVYFGINVPSMWRDIKNVRGPKNKNNNVIFLSTLIILYDVRCQIMKRVVFIRYLLLKKKFFKKIYRHYIPTVNRFSSGGGEVIHFLRCQPPKIIMGGYGTVLGGPLDRNMV